MSETAASLGSRPVQRSVSLIALALAGGWCVALLIAAATLPAYSGEYVSSTGIRTTAETLVDVNGSRVLAVVALPLIPVVTVTATLWRRRRAHRPGAGPVAWAAVCILWAFAFITGFTIGLFVLPVVGLLAIACATTYGPSPPSGASLALFWKTRTKRHPREWVPCLLFAAVWLIVSAILPGPALFLAFVVSVIGWTTAIVRYHHNPSGPLPSTLFVGISLLVGSGTLLLTAHLVA